MRFEGVPIYIFFAGILLLFGSSCNTTRHLADDEVLLNKNIIEFDDDLDVEKRRKLRYQLSTITKQKPNTKFVGLIRTRLWLFNRTKDAKSRFRKWLRKRVAEPPSLYNEKLAEETAESMQYYLNNKGYFNAVVTHKDNLPDIDTLEGKKRQKITEVTYVVRPNRVYSIDSLYFNTGQAEVQTVFETVKDKTLLKPGKPIDSRLFDEEKNRLVREMRNWGYAFFYPNYIKFRSYDSLDYKADVTIEVLPPTDSTKHESYTIDKVYIYPDYYPAITGARSYDTTNIDGYEFVIAEKIGVRTKPILNGVFLKKGQIYTQEDYEDTTRKLDDLGIYKFVSVRLSNPKADNKVDVFILLTPNKKMELGYDVEVNTDNEAIMGTAFSTSYRNLNIFKGAEVFRINGNFGLDFSLKQEDAGGRFRGVDVGLETEIYLPKFLVPFDLPGISRRNDPKTRFALNYNYFDRIEYFRSNLFSLSFGYEWNETFTKSHRLNPINLNYFDLQKVRGQFQAILDGNTYLQNSFTDQLFPGISYTYTYTGQPRTDGSSWYFRGTAETAGNSMALVDNLIQPDNTFEPGGIPYSQFARLDTDVRYYKKITRKSAIAARLASGVGTAYGQSEALPYVKQFFVGGPSSIRAWRIRDLGPGEYQDTDTLSQAYQAGDFKLEANLEYRFDIFSVVEGALFADAGNIWLLKDDGVRTNGVLTSDFYRGIAVGVGYGIRLDYSYFIIRFDMAYKVKNPFPNDQGNYRFYPNGFFQDFSFKDTVFNLAIGYPF